VVRGQHTNVCLPVEPTAAPYARLRRALAADAADSLADLGGAMPEVARSRLAFVLRNGGAVDAARLLERA
jgi:hypothetical protein